MNITLKSVSPLAMRYVTCGDWEPMPDGSINVTVVDYGREDGAFLVALHELVEAYICRKRGVTDEQVTEWDLRNPELEEPGDHPNAPYLREHRVATHLEFLVCQELGLDWDEHNRWVQRAAEAVEDALRGAPSSIVVNGPRAWAELHLFALRHDGSDDSEWLSRWVKSLNFEGCPCEEHLKKHLADCPPRWSDLFNWSVELHNAVNQRLGRPEIDAKDARKLWTRKLF